MLGPETGGSSEETRLEVCGDVLEAGCIDALMGILEQGDNLSEKIG